MPLAWPKEKECNVYEGNDNRMVNIFQKTEGQKYLRRPTQK